MASGPRYRVPFRRRRLGKTNYHLRRRLVRSDSFRLVTRVSNKHALAQIIQATSEGDRTLAVAHSRELTAYDWKANTGNLSAAYLTGYLLGHKAKQKELDSAILDLGLAVPTYGSRIFSLLQGVIDAGLEVPHSETVFPPEERIKGEHIASYAKTLKKQDKEAYETRFSGYLSRKSPPEDLPKYFLVTKEKIEKEFGKPTAKKPAAKKPAAKKKAAAKKPTAKKKAPAKKPAAKKKAAAKKPAAKKKATKKK